MALITITQSSTADLTVVNNGYALYVRTAPGGSARLTVVSGLSGFAAQEVCGQALVAFPASGVVRVTAVAGSIAYELGTGQSRGTISFGVQPEDVMNVKQLSATVLGTPIPLTGPVLQGTNTIDNYTQFSIINLSATANSSADHIAYCNNGTDVAGWIDTGITSSAYAQAAYSVTGANEGYIFMSGPTGTTGTGDLVFATDSTGTSNGHRWYVSGFTQAIGLYSMKLTGTGLLQVCNGSALAGLSKVVVNNGATTSYTVPAKCSYVNLTTSAASLAMTFPVAAAAIDGLMITVVPSAVVATVTWASTGATFIGAPAAFAANTPVRMIYDHASLKWYQA